MCTEVWHCDPLTYRQNSARDVEIHYLWYNAIQEARRLKK